MGLLDHAAERGQDLLIGHHHGTVIRPSRDLFAFSTNSKKQDQGISMLRTRICLAAAALLVAGALHTASAQTTAPAAAPAATSTPAAKSSKVKLTVEKLKAMKAKWNENKVKLKACRKEVKSLGLVGDDRWFYIGDCMDKT
jgi:hypothetical protein